MFLIARPKLASSPMSVNDGTFSRIVAVRNNGDIDVELTVNVSQLYAVKNGTFTVNATVRKNNIAITSKFTPTNVSLTGRQMINNIVMQGQNVKGLALSKAQNVVDFRCLDVLAKVNKESLSTLYRTNDQNALKSLLSTPELSRFTYAFVSVADLKRAATRKPVLQRYLINNDIDDRTVLNELSTATSFIDSNVSSKSVLKSTSPSMRQVQDMRYASIVGGSTMTSLDSTSTRALSSADAMAGTNNFVRVKSQQLSELVDYLTLPPIFIERNTHDVSDKDQVLLSTVRFVEYVPIKVTVTISGFWDSSNLTSGVSPSYDVVFELIDSVNRGVLDTLSKQLDITGMVNLSYVPKSSPKMTSGVVQNSVTHLDISTNDETISDVTVYKKTFTRVSPINVNSSFMAMGDKQRLVNGTLRIDNNHPGSNVDVYRVIPTGKTKVMGASFTDVVVQKDKRFVNKFVSVVAAPSPAGMTVELRGFSPDVSAIQVLRRDLSLNEKYFTAVGDISLVNSQNVITSYDSDLKQQHTYEYSSKLLFKNGTTQIFGSAIVDYIVFNDGIDTRVTDVTFTATPKPDVSFTLNTLVTQSDLDFVSAMLETQNLKTFFNDDLLKERDKLQQLIAHNVVRVNLTDGIREDFGVITDSLFVDSTYRKRCSAEDLDTVKEYRYEVCALLRTPETMFEEYVKKSTDVTTGKDYAFKPSKFNHPVTLSKGNITSTSSRNAHYGQKQMMFGKVGNVEIVNVTFARHAVTISSASAVLRSAREVSVSWSTSGNDQIDHFVVLSVVNDVRRFVGTAHPHWNTKDVKFLHAVSHSDLGYARYAIIPVLNDYTQLAETFTNNILIQ